MRKMKDSGIEWIGEIPTGWKFLRAKYFIQNPKDINFGKREKNILSLTLKGVVRNDPNNPIGLVPSNYSSYQIFYKNDLVFKLIDLENVSTSRVGIVPEKGIMSSAYVRGQVNDRYLNPKYAFYWYYNLYNKEIYNKLGSGVRSTLTASELFNIKIALPPLQDQTAIANYLDKVTDKISSLKSSIQAQIDSLKEYRNSIITEAVTKGLDKDAKMKDSGIEWIGEIPVGWETRPLSYYFREHKNQNFRGLENNLLSLSYGKIIRRNIDSRQGLLPANFYSYNIVESGDIVLRLTDLQNDKKSLRTGLCCERGIITSAYVTLRKNKNINSNYFHYLLHAYDVKKIFYGMGSGVRQGLNYSELSKLILLGAPLQDQTAIANYLDEKTSKIDSIIKKKEDQIKLLDEYQKSLIFEYVTGKKEVPGA